MVVTVGMIAGLVAFSAVADSPTLQDFLAAMDLSSDEIDRARAGEIISGTAKASHDREIVATLAFLIHGVSPDELVKRGEGGLLDKVDEQTIAYSILQGAPTLESFSKLRLRTKNVEKFRKAKAGDDLNLSQDEIDTLQKLGKDPEVDKVEAAIHAALLARMKSYQAKGLAGIAPYQRSHDELRSAAEDLKLASLATKAIKQITPDAYRLLLEYPSSIPEGTQETYRWGYLEAHDEPTIVLTHNLYIPEGETWIVVQRQFYVSEGYNSEQAIAAFVPVSEGTVVFYINRTSTDQVSGFGGGAKRSIGSKLLASQLRALFAKVSEVVETP